MRVADSSTVCSPAVPLMGVTESQLAEDSASSYTTESVQSAAAVNATVAVRSSSASSVYSVFSMVRFPGREASSSFLQPVRARMASRGKR